MKQRKGLMTHRLSGLKKSCQALDRQRLPEVYISSSPSCSSDSPLYRFQPRGLGSSHGPTFGIRVLISSMEDPAHQCSRDAGSMLALQAFADYIKGNSILLFTDKTTVAAYLNRQGGTHSQSLCNMAVEIMLWCAKNRVHIKARYLPGRLNALADCLSRKGNVVQTEWKSV